MAALVTKANAEFTLKAASTPAEIYAGVLNTLNGTGPVGSPHDIFDATVNLLKVLDAFVSVVREVPVIGTIANAASLGSNVKKALESLERDGSIAPSLVWGLVGDALGIFSTAAFAAAAGSLVVAGTTISAPVVATVAGLTALAGIAASAYGATIGIQEKRNEVELATTWSANILANNQLFNQFKWSLEEGKFFTDNFGTDPVVGPTLLLVRAIGGTISLNDAINLVEQADLSGELQGGRLREVSTLLRGISRVVTGQDIAPATSLDTLIPTLRTLWNTAEQNAGRFNFSLVHNAATARTDFAAFLSLQLGLTFSVRLTDSSPTGVSTAAISTSYPGLFSMWLSDKALKDQGASPDKLTFTDAYLRDRAEMFNAVADQMRRNVANVITGLPVDANTEYFDVTTGRQVLIGATTTRRQIYFGDEAANTKAGGGLNDRLYGGGGNDSLVGQGGNDYLEGGAGNDDLDSGQGADELSGGSGYDTYRFTDQWGADLIEDSDGQGNLIVDGIGAILGAGSRKIAENAWQTNDKRVRYSLVKVDTQQSDLYITFNDRPDSIHIRNWSNGSLGITLPDTLTEPEATGTIAGDIKKKLQSDGITYVIGPDGNYVRDGDEPDAKDIITGRSEGDSLQGLGGNDGLAGGFGDDILEGGDGNDLLIGNAGSDTIKGGAGSDYIIGSETGTLVHPASTTTSPVLAQGMEVYRGLSWVVDQMPGQRVVRGISNGGYLSDDNGNVIDAGDDSDLVLAGSGDDVVRGGQGADGLWGLAGNDFIEGGTEGDLLVGDSPYWTDPTALNYAPQDKHGNDILVGGEGNDSLYGDGGDDALYGGSGDDTLFGENYEEGQTNATFLPGQYHGADYLDGGDGNDNLMGSGRGDTLYGGIGNDSLRGDDSPQSLDGSFHGDDYLDGEEGDDLMQGDGGADTLFGGSGADTMSGDTSTNNPAQQLSASFNGQDYLDGEAGNDQLIGGGNADVLFGGEDNDTLLGDDYTSRLAGSAHGADYLDGEGGNDYLEGGGDADELFGGDGADTLVGDAAEASLSASYHGDDYLDGEAGDDQLQGNGGQDTLVGGEGNDLLFGDSSGAGLQVQGDDSLDGGTGLDTLVGGGGNDALDGGNGDDMLRGDDILDVVATSAHGADVLSGGSGNDVLLGDGSNDTLNGGEGNDWLAGEDELSSTVVSSLSGNDVLDGGSGLDTLLGGNGDDRLDGGADADQLFGGAGADVLLGGYGADQLLGGDGADTLDGGADNDALWGDAGNDALTGGTGDDTLMGGAGNDTLDGGDGNDLLYGDDGDDTFILGGADQAAGGSGTNTYVISAGANNCLIDLTASVGATTRIVFGSGVYSTVASRVGADLAITYGGTQNTVWVHNYYAQPNAPLQVQFATGLSWTEAAVSGLAPGQTATISTAGSVATTGSYVLPDGYQWLSLQGSSAASLTGNNQANQITAGAGADTLTGLGGDDQLSGLGGDDVFTGGAGFDRLSGDVGNDTYRFGWGAGHDLVSIAGSSSTVGDRIVFDSGIAPGSVSLRRDALDLVVLLGNGADRITVFSYFSTTTSNDALTLQFADGTNWRAADISARTTAPVVTVASNGAGIDTVTSDGSYALAPDQENLTLSGSFDASLWGNAGANVLTGNSGANVFNSPGSYRFDPTMDYANFGQTADWLTSSGNWLVGDGPDTLIGGGGDDVYFLGVPDGLNTSQTVPPDETIIEAAGGGVDTVVSYAYGTGLDANVERLFGMSHSQWSRYNELTGNYDPIAHAYIGNDLANLIDTTHAQGVTLLDGGAGADTMIGGAGSNTFVVDNTGDVVITYSGYAASQTVKSSINYTLTSALGNLTLTTSSSTAAPLIGTGTDQSNILHSDNIVYEEANPGVFHSAGIGDTLVGLGGDDTYYIDEGDHLVEQANAGNDTVVIVAGSSDVVYLSDFANVENLETTYGGGLVGDEHDNVIRGGLYANNLYGGSGDDEITDTNTLVRLDYLNLDWLSYDSDMLHGGEGNDHLTSTLGIDAIWGDAGDDTIVFRQTNPVRDSFGGIYDKLIPRGQVNFSRGDGNDTVSVERVADGYRYVGVKFGTGIDITDLSFVRTGNDVVISVSNNGGTVTVRDVFAEGAAVTDTPSIWVGLLFEDATYNLWPVPGAPSFMAARLLTNNTDVPTEAGELLVGTNLADTINAAGGDDMVIGGSGNDSLLGGWGSDRIWGGVGDDWLSAGNSAGLAEYVTDELDGGAGNDTLIGGDYGNVLRGGEGNDLLSVGATDPASVDRLEGGTGNDTYVIGKQQGYVEITESGGTDVIQLGTGISAANMRVMGDYRPHLCLQSLDGALTVVVNYGLATSVDIPEASDSYAVEEVRFSDGTVWTAAQMRQMSTRIEGTAGADSLTGTALDDQIFGYAGNDVLDAGDGTDLLDGGTGTDTMRGGLGDDTYVVDASGDVTTESANSGIDTVQSSITRTLGLNLENLVLTGNNVINGTGNTLNNVLTGNAAANRLDGSAGNDTMAGGAGNDTYVVDAAGDVVTELAGEGTDTVESSISLTLTAELENLTLTGSAALNATGNASANVLTGNSGNNVLDGAAGADSLAGGAGNDTYLVDNTGDVVTEAASAGTDLVQTTVTYTLGLNVENLTLMGTGAIGGTGNTSANVITGNSAANTLDGGTGTDTLIGGAGNDTYIVDATAEVVTEFANEGVDTVQSSATYTLSANVENLTLIGTSALNGSGNTLANVITGNAGANTLDGGASDDTMLGGAGNDIYYVDAVNDVVTELANEGSDLVQASVTYTLSANVEHLILAGTSAINGTGNTLDNALTGNGANNTLTGGAGNDTLNGGIGADSLVGGTGDDTYAVDNTGDVVTEAAGEGNDLVQSAVTYTLSNNVENLTLTSTGTTTGNGNSLNNVLTGNGANNTLNGFDGNDTLDGGLGNDTLVGGLGNDTYVVNVTTDVITENSGQGIDTVLAGLTWTLNTTALANVENVTLTGTSTFSATGNAQANLLIGNGANNTLTGLDGNDTLDGGLGNDTLVGGLGDDTYVVNVTTDVITESASQGIDTVMAGLTWTLNTTALANVENVTLTGTNAVNATGNASANVLTGNSANNTLSGLGGTDTLDGGAGNDMLDGGAAADTYRFSRGYGQDTVVDNDTTAGVKDRIQFGAGIVQADMRYTRVGNNLEALINGTADKIVVQNWYLGNQYHVEEFRFNDGSILTDAQVQGLVGAMASFGATAAGATSGERTMTRGTPSLELLTSNALV